MSLAAKEGFGATRAAKAAYGRRHCRPERSRQVHAVEDAQGCSQQDGQSGENNSIYSGTFIL